MNRAPFRDRARYPVWRTIGTRWADNDVYGHVNNVVYYQWFDTAVNAWLIEQGLLGRDAGGPIGLVVETGCRYARPLSFPQPVEIGLAVERIGTSSVRYQLGVFAAGEDDPSAEGEFVHVYVDRESRTPTPIPAEWRLRLSGISASPSH